MPSAERPDPDDARRLVYAHRPSRDTPRAIGRGVPISLFGFSSCGDGAGGSPCLSLRHSRSVPGLSPSPTPCPRRREIPIKPNRKRCISLSDCLASLEHDNRYIARCMRSDRCAVRRVAGVPSRAGTAPSSSTAAGRGRDDLFHICESIFGISAVCTVWIIQFSHPLLLSQRTIETLSDR